MEIYTKQTIAPFFYTNLIHSTPQGYHTHTFWEITISITGQAVNVMYNTQHTQMSRGDVMLFRPHDCHYIRPLLPPLNYTHRDVYIFDETFHNICDVLQPGLYQELKTASSPVFFHLVETELININNHFNFFFDFNQRTPTADAIHSSLVSYLLGLYLKSKVMSKNSIPNWLTNFLIELQSPAMFNLPIPKIIQKTNYSHGYVCSVFKSAVHKTLLEYVTDLRMNYAASLLSTPNYSVLQIAMLLGYTSPGNFISAFKKHFKMTPKQWQKAHTQSS